MKSLLLWRTVSTGNGVEFINEVGIIGKTCQQCSLSWLLCWWFKRALVYEYLANESLEKFYLQFLERVYLLVGRSFRIFPLASPEALSIFIKDVTRESFKTRESFILTLSYRISCWLKIAIQKFLISVWRNYVPRFKVLFPWLQLEGPWPILHLKFSLGTLGTCAINLMFTVLGWYC